MNFLGGSLRVGRLFGIEIRAHFVFLFYIGYRVLSAAQGGGNWWFELLSLVGLFGIVLVHEFGHCFGARSVGGYADHILMWPLGGLAYADAPMRPWPQFVTVAAGPLVNVIFCLLSAGAIFAVTGGGVLPSINPLNPVPWILDFTPRMGAVMDKFWFMALFMFYEVNLMLLAFNMLPIYPFDGGQIFQCLLWPFLGLHRAMMIACQVGLAGCIILAWLGLRVEGMMMVCIAIFGGLTCWQRLQAIRRGWLIEEPSYEVHEGPSNDPRPWWRRILGLRVRRRPAGDANPNPGGWANRMARLETEENELDRLLRKVSSDGIHSLSYVERQRLERITRERQQRDRDIERGAPGGD